MELIFSAILGYIFGSFPVAFIIGKILAKKDIRDYGTGNSGASNLTSMLGWKAGIITAVLDILKGVAPIIIIKVFDSGWSFPMLFLAGGFAVLGHIFPLFLKFRGGKGTATMAGVLIGLDYRVALICMAILLLLLVLTDYVTPGVVTVCLVVPFLFVIFGYSWVSLLLIPVSLLMIFKHIPNMKRIINHEETGIRDFLKRKRK